MFWTRVFVAGAAILTVSVSHADAQLGGLGNRVRDQLQRRTTSCAADEVLQSGACVKRESKKEQSDADDEPRAQSSDAPAADQPKATELKAGEGAWANYDFVPGDRILFAEDFTADRVGNFPRRLELEKGTFEVVEWNARRWLRANDEGEFTVALPQALPERWTLEFELTLPGNGMYFYPGTETDRNPDEVQSVHLGLGSVYPSVPGKNNTMTDPRTLFGDDLAPGDTNLSRPLHVRLQADAAYMKVYLEEHRVINLPNMGRWTGNALHFYFRSNTYDAKPASPLMTGLSLHAGGTELYDALMAGGRLAVPGVYFDTGSDRIRPESSGTLREILDMLSAHPDLRLVIEGHTDNVGDSGKNKTLSEQRALAVLTYLVEHGTTRARLQSAGFGDTKPSAPNDSPENRQRNRRVELVVQQ